MDQKVFETEARQNIQELSTLVADYDREEQESELAEFSGYDPLKGIIRALAAKFRSEQNLGSEESLQKADQIVRSAEEEVKKPSAKAKICSALKSFTGDSMTILPLLLELAKSGVIVISFDPTGVFVVSVACLIIGRMGIEAFCAE